MATGTIRPETLSEEGRYRFDERLGILCGGGKPTRMQEHLAWREAVNFDNERKQLTINKDEGRKAI